MQLAHFSGLILVEPIFAKEDWGLRHSNHAYMSASAQKLRIFAESYHLLVCWCMVIVREMHDTF